MYSKKLGSLFMSKQQELLERIQAEFQPHFATVENESHMHSSGRGADSHFKLVKVCAKCNVTKNFTNFLPMI